MTTLSTALLPAALALFLLPASPAVENSPQAAAPAAASTFDHSHAAWTSILAERVQGDLFDYAGLAKDRVLFDRYARSLAAVTSAELAGWTREQRFAFWINAYNTFTIQKVVDSYPIDSIKDLSTGLFGRKSVFDKEFIPMVKLHPGGDDDRLSLNDIEHPILRARFKDARVHAAINCASASCPPLRNEAFEASKLDEQLESQMRAFVMDTVRNHYNAKKNAVQLSNIFKWFKEDFVRDAGGVREYLTRYAPESMHALLKKGRVSHLPYSWALNEALPKKAE